MCAVGQFGGPHEGWRVGFLAGRISIPDDFDSIGATAIQQLFEDSAGREVLHMDASEKSLRKWLAWLLDGGGAHVDFDTAVKGLPAKLRGARAPGLPHTPWQLLEHMRIAQWDILDFSRNSKYQQRSWPEGYWPKNEGPGRGEWEKSVRAFHDDLAAIRKLVTSARTDLHAPIPWGEGQTLLREALLLADHNAYHLGQLVLVRRALGAWKD